MTSSWLSGAPRRFLSAGARGRSVSLGILARYGTVWLVLLATYVLGLVGVPSVVSGSQIVPIITSAVPLICLAIGQTVLILERNFDLSVGGVVALINVLAAGPIATQLGGVAMIPICVAIGLGTGLVNGVGIVVFDISPFIMTLGMGFVLTGATLVYTGGAPSGNIPAAITALSSNKLFGVTWSIYIVAVAAAISWYLLTRTRIGRAVYLQGLNPLAARLCGVSGPALYVCSYAFSGLMAGIGGVLLAGYVQQGSLGAGQSLLLTSIAAVVIGGTTFDGGRGGLIGSIGGALFFSALSPVLIGLGLGDSAIDIISGAVLIAAALLFVSHRRAR